MWSVVNATSFAVADSVSLCVGMAGDVATQTESLKRSADAAGLDTDNADVKPTKSDGKTWLIQQLELMEKSLQVRRRMSLYWYVSLTDECSGLACQEACYYRALIARFQMDLRQRWSWGGV